LRRLAGLDPRLSPARPPSADTPKWLERLDETNWLLAVVVGAFMLTYSLTLATAAEILKAHVSTADSLIAFVVFRAGLDHVDRRTDRCRPVRAGTLGREACAVAAMAARTSAHRRPRRVDGHRRHRGRRGIHDLLAQGESRRPRRRLHRGDDGKERGRA
jgi:hypothetical protein